MMYVFELDDYEVVVVLLDGVVEYNDVIDEIHLLYEQLLIEVDDDEVV